MLGEVGADGSLTWDPSAQVQVIVNVVVDLDTLRGAADDLALIDGAPVPAALARDAADAATWWRRWVTDPVDGHLLDFGTRTYLPDRLRRYVLARDGGCRRPGCTTRASSRLQMDHALPFPAGPSDAANCGTLCVACHQVKTAGRAYLLDSAADGSATWATAWGQRIHIPPRPALGDPRPSQPMTHSARDPGPGPGPDPDHNPDGPSPPDPPPF